MGKLRKRKYHGNNKRNIRKHLLSGDVDSVYLPLNALTIYSFVFYLMIQWIIFFGQKQVLIGRVLFDYRKIKRVTYPKKTKLRFTYGQKTLETYIRFIDDSILKKSYNLDSSPIKKQFQPKLLFILIFVMIF